MTNPLQLKACRTLLLRCLRLLDPPPALKVWQWGELRRRMGRNVTAKPGRYRVATAPYQREPQEAFLSPDVQTTVLYWGKRLGKTELINNLHGSTIEQNPRNILVVYPTLDSAKKWSKQFFTPLIKSTPALRDKIKDARSREANNTILAKEFPGGTISAIGANSPSGFRQVQAPVVTCDEVDAMEDGAEGDPVELAFGRAENYPDSVQVVSSTATKLHRPPDKDADGDDDTEQKETSGSKIHDWWLLSDQRKYFVPCPFCAHMHVMMWSGVKWPDGHKHEEAWYECPKCEKHWNDQNRLHAILSGDPENAPVIVDGKEYRAEWRATAPFHGVRGYWLNGLNTTFAPKKGYKTKLHQMAKEFYTAYRKGEKARLAWKNTFLCEPHIEETEKPDIASIYDRCEDYTPQTLPDSICVVILSVDVQGDRLEYEFSGWGEGEESWGIEYGKIMGDPEKEEVWQTLKDKTAATFKRTDGIELKVDAVAIDHRHKGNRVRKFAKTCGHPRVYPCYGTGTKQSILVKPNLNKHYKIYLYSVNTDTGKDTLFARLRLKEMGARYLHFPKSSGYEKQTNGFFEQLTAEEVRITYKRGFAERTYEKIRARNEGLDMRVYALAAIDILRPAFKRISENLLASRKPKDYPLTPTEPATESPPEPKPEPRRFNPVRRRGFVGSRGKWL